MQFRNAVQLAYGIPGIVAYVLVFYGMFGVRKILCRSFVIIFTIMSASVCSIDYILSQIVFQNIATWLNAWVYLKLTNEPFFFFYYEWLVDRQLLM